ncbi:riboflavin synthase [Ahniella affigens]|uniref:Riboflavin synthase n=1 Tax=Ahniella affigens TaxID=2021234 RepID=A0A2P1PYM2_9GAMM|nr:riboflavin synthase [Ahniella affigens]AVP99930.1 riboflavin synthase [Ahniella affigens]
MFTGLVQAMGTIITTETRGGDCRLLVDSRDLPGITTVQLGDSIAHAGVCLTVVGKDGTMLAYDVSIETLSRTTLQHWQAGQRVNLEGSLRMGDALGGHLVSGHVDGVGQLVDRQHDARAIRMRFQMPVALAPFIAEKGSIAVDGVSLTVNAVTRDTFDVAIIPHTAVVTTLGLCNVGDPVNLEIDLIARYVARMRAFQ